MTFDPAQPPFGYPPLGTTIDGKYLVEKVLGEGGMGAVVKATHLLRRAPVALKFMAPQFVAVPGAVGRFVNEGVAASQITSDHVVQVFDVGTLPPPWGAPYLVMEYLAGCDLAELLARDGRPGLEVPRAVHFVVQALRGLQVAHAAGIVHRDMKPSNCFVVTKDGEGDFVKLLDFGISKVQQPGHAALTRTNSALGTPLYMSPEQARSPRDVDARTDVYSTGVILYELLCGKTPFFSESGELTEVLYKLFTADVPPIDAARPDLPPGLAEVVHRALVRDPAERFPTARAFAEALAPFSDGRSGEILRRILSSGTASTEPPARRYETPAAPAPQPHTPAEAQPMATAATLGAGSGLLMSAARPPADPAVRTDLGASRDRGPGEVDDAERAAAPRRAGIAIGVAGFFVVAAAAAFVVVALRSRTPPSVEGSAVPADSVTAPPRGVPATSGTPGTMVIVTPSPRLDPPASASSPGTASASAAPSASAIAPPRPPPHAPPPPTTTPTTPPTTTTTPHPPSTSPPKLNELGPLR